MPKNIASDTWKDEWVGMPEFIQPEKKPYAKIVFRFDTEEDLAEFCKRIGQNLNKNTKSARYPKKEESEVSSLVYDYGTQE